MWEPDVFPGESEWNALTSLADKHEAKWMIWEGEPLAESVAQLEQLGNQSIVFSPAANVPEEGDFIEVMQNNVAELTRAFSQSE
jgi:hypothetical protein